MVGPHKTFRFFFLKIWFIKHAPLSTLVLPSGIICTYLHLHTFTQVGVKMGQQMLQICTKFRWNKMDW